jgi:hypothetical protein
LGRLYAGRAIALTAVTAAVLAGSGPLLAGDSTVGVPQYSGTRLMLFVRLPIGARRNSASTFGIRYERATAVTSGAVMPCCALLRHQALVELQLARGAAARVQFGNRVTWDLRSHQLAPTAMFNGSWPLFNGSPTGAMRSAWTP